MPERAMDYALWLLGRQAYSEAEMRARLGRRALPQADIDRVVARLRELNLVNDARFAQGYVRNRQHARGRLALRGELKRKGIRDDTIDDVIAGGDGDTALDDAQQAAAATQLLRKHAWRFTPKAVETGDDERLARLEAQKRMARAAAFLARRGFTPDAVRQALADAWGDEPLA